jgi:hypothetical protein
MTSQNDIYQDRVIALLGTQLSNGVKDFGKIVDFITITENMSIRYVFVTDTGRKIDAGSALRFMQAYRRKLAGENATAIVFPDGSDTVMKRRVMRVRRSGMHSVTGTSITNVAKFSDGESINISSTVTSAGAFPEEYNIQKGI